MADSPNRIGQAVDDAVSALTTLVRLTSQIEGVSFAERLIDVLSHVAANAHGVDGLLGGADPDQARLIRALLAQRPDLQDLIAWRTTPIVVPVLTVHPSAYSETAPPRSWTAEALERYESAILTAMNHQAAELGYNAPVIYETATSVHAPADDQLTDFLIRTAQDHVPPPSLT